MPGFLYYLPNLQTVSLADAKAAGLDYVFDSANPQCVGVANGPAGQHGCVFGREAFKLGYYPQRQTWRKIPGSAAWLGWETENLPGPEELGRGESEQVRGEWVRLGDGKEWLCPIARVLDQVVLPRAADLDENGRWVEGPVRAKYRQLERVANEFWPLFASAKGELVYENLNASAAICIGVNYYVSPIEIASLGLLDGEISQFVLRAAVNWLAIEPLLKKDLSDRRYLDYRRWAEGRDEDYSPSLAEMAVFALESDRGE